MPPQPEREAEERRRQRIGALVAAALVLATVAIATLALTAGGGGSDKPDAGKVRALERLAEAAGCSVRTFPEEGHRHTRKPVTYRTNPPTSGNHNPLAARDGEYTSGGPPEEAVVHALEHGRIVLQYRANASAAARAGLKRVFDEDTSKMLLLQNETGMPYEVAATAWTRLIGCPRYGEEVPAALAAFRDAYRDKAPEQVP